ncbi:MAG: hypothetical protein PHW15_02805 [Patescibacteria group bacterium]|nr:hypothetical protein [Patescibacteria group bacterium]
MAMTEFFPELLDTFEEFKKVEKDDTKFKIAKFGTKRFVAILLNKVLLSEAWKILTENFKEHMTKASALDDNIIFLVYDKNEDKIYKSYWKITFHISTWAKNFEVIMGVDSELEKNRIIESIKTIVKDNTPIKYFYERKIT